MSQKFIYNMPNKFLRGSDAEKENLNYPPKRDRKVNPKKEDSIMKKTKLIRCLTLVIAFALMLCACSRSDSGTDASGTDSAGKDTLTVVISNDPGSFDPHNSADFAHHQVTRQIYETLVVRDKDGKLAPCLAESWEYENDTTIIFHIRKGVHFHNGDELKASDVLFSMRRVVNDNVNGQIQVTSIDLDASEVVDDYTLKVVLKAPSAIQMAMLESPMICIISEKVYNDNNGDLNAAPIGTGPYKFVSYNAGDRAELTANDKYWVSGEPKVKNIVFRFISDASSRAIEAESGGADIVYDISANDIARLRDNPNVNLLSTPGYNTSYLTFNVAKAPLDNPKVREAIWYAVDVASGIKVSYGEYGSVAKNFVTPGIEGAHPDLTPFLPARDVEKAKQLLTEAGYENGFTIHVSCENSNQQRMDLAQALQAQLQEVGITVELDYMEMNTWISELLAGNGELALFGITASSGEAGNVLARFAPDSSIHKIFGWVSPEYAELMSKALATTDDAARAKMFYELQEMIMKDYVALPVWHKELNAALKPNVKGFEFMPTYEQHYLGGVYFE